MIRAWSRKIVPGLFLKGAFDFVLLKTRHPCLAAHGPSWAAEVFRSTKSKAPFKNKLKEAWIDFDFVALF